MCTARKHTMISCVETCRREIHADDSPAAACAVFASVRSYDAYIRMRKKRENDGDDS